MASRKHSAVSCIKLTRLIDEERDIHTIANHIAENLYTNLIRYADLSFVALVGIDTGKNAVEFKSIATRKNLSKVSKILLDEITTTLTEPHPVLDQLTGERQLVVLSRENNDIRIHLWNKHIPLEGSDGSVILYVYMIKGGYGMVIFALNKKLMRSNDVLPIFEVYAAFAEMSIKNYYLNVENRGAVEGVAGKVQDLEREKEEFLSMVAHELRAPTSAMKGYLSMVIQGDAGSIPEKAQGFLVDVANENDRLIRLVNNMLNVSRIEEDKLSYQLEVESLTRVARTVYSQFLPEAKRKGLEFSLEIPPDLKDRVLVDPERLHEATSNFVSNAVKYTIAGKVIIRLSNPKHTRIKMEVIDTGPGVSKEEQFKLFAKFHRAESNVGKTTGTGLGLYITKLLVEKFNGKIGMESKVGKGSTFWFELPLSS